MEFPPILFMDTNEDWIEGANSFAEQGSDLEGWIQSVGQQISPDLSGLGWTDFIKEQSAKAVPDMFKPAVPEVYRAPTGAAAGVFAGVQPKRTVMEQMFDYTTKGTAFDKTIPATSAARSVAAGTGILTAAPAGPSLIDKILDSPIALGIALYLGIKYL